MSAQPTSRRSLLKGGALLTAVPVAAAARGVPFFDVVGSPEPIADETPMGRLFCQWEMAHAEQEEALKGVKGSDFQAKVAQEDLIYDTLGARRRRIEEAILAELATDLRDFAIKVLVNSGEGSFALDDVLTLECAALASRDFAKIPRCLFGTEVKAACDSFAAPWTTHATGSRERGPVSFWVVVK